MDLYFKDLDYRDFDYENLGFENLDSVVVPFEHQRGWNVVSALPSWGRVRV